jgi:preprotein translocase subunit SecE
MPDNKVEVKKANAVSRWWRETVGELRKVTWPTRSEAIRLTRIVIVVMALMSAMLGILDYVFTQLVAFILTKI